MKRPPKAKKLVRVAIADEVVAEVLKRCQRHCCLCLGLHSKLSPTDGQIAHVDRNPSNPALENLVYLCLECHKVYDNKNNRVQSYTPAEIMFYRDKLYRKLRIDIIQWTLTVSIHKSHYDKIKSIIEEVRSSLVKHCSDVHLVEGPVI